MSDERPLSPADREALSLVCPHCLRPPESWCIYTNALPGSGHELGDETRRLHAERRKMGKARLARRDRQETRHRLTVAQARIEALTRELALVREAASLGFSPAPLAPDLSNPEHAALRSWLARFGSILWEQPGGRTGS